MMRIRPNVHVTLDYTLRDADGAILDQSEGEDGEPIRYVHGYGMLVPGLEAGLVGLAEGEEKSIVVNAPEGFGERDEELVLEIERSEFPDPQKVAPGDEFVAESPDGDEVVMRVVEIRDDAVIVDANHPLAGVTLHYTVTVRAIRDATEEELGSAAAEFEEAEEHEHVHGPDCDHGDPDLVSLGKKPDSLKN